VSQYLYATLADATTAATYNFCLKITSPKPSAIKTVPSLEFKICSSTTIVPPAAMVSKQIVMTGAAEMRFKIPYYA